MQFWLLAILNDFFMMILKIEHFKVNSAYLIRNWNTGMEDYWGSYTHKFSTWWIEWLFDGRFLVWLGLSIDFWELHSFNDFALYEHCSLNRSVNGASASCARETYEFRWRFPCFKLSKPGFVNTKIVFCHKIIEKVLSSGLKFRFIVFVSF